MGYVHQPPEIHYLKSGIKGTSTVIEHSSHLTNESLRFVKFEATVAKPSDAEDSRLLPPHRCYCDLAQYYCLSTWILSLFIFSSAMQWTFTVGDGRVVCNFVAQVDFVLLNHLVMFSNLLDFTDNGCSELQTHDLQALHGQPLTVYGHGKQTRSFQYVSDLVDVLMALMEDDHIGPFNLGNPGEFIMLELAEVVKETIESSATIEFKPNTADDPHMRKQDITKAKELLKWEPNISLREGWSLMVTDFRKQTMHE